MPDHPLISIVLATYNGARYLPAQMESLLAQTYQNFEIIISDDGSQDGTAEIIEKFAKSDLRIHFFRNQKRLGVAPHFLKALASARGEFICFCDQDDYWRADKIELLLRLIQKEDDIMLAYSDLEICDENLQTLLPSFWHASGIQPVCGAYDERILIRHGAPGCSMLFRRIIKDQMAGIETDIFMHDHLAFALSCALGKVVFTPEKLVKYRQHSANTIGLKAPVFNETEFFAQLQKRIDFFKSRFGPQKHFDLERLIRFQQHGTELKMFGNCADLKYFWVMGTASLKDRLLSTLKCIFPKFYRAFKSKFYGEKHS